jgi:hypothetical protein
MGLTKKQRLSRDIVNKFLEADSDEEEGETCEEKCFCPHHKGTSIGVGEKPKKCPGFGMLPCPEAK